MEIVGLTSQSSWKKVKWPKQHNAQNITTCSEHHFTADRWGNNGNSDRLYFSGSIITADGYCSHEIKTLAPWKEAMTNVAYKKQRHYFANKGLYSQSYDSSSGHVWMWELAHKQGWVPENWRFWTVALEKTPLDCREIEPVNPKGNQPWIFIGRTDEAETPDAKNWLIGKDLDAGKD